MRRALALCALAAAVGAGPAFAQGGAPEVRLEPTRDFGYLTGDRIELRGSVRVPPGFRLDPASARPGTGSDWLELREAAWERERVGGATRYRFRLVYQVFFVPDSLTRLSVPPRAVRFRSREGGEEMEAVLPAFAFSLSPLTDSTTALAADWPVPAPSLRGVAASAAFLALFVGLFGALGLLERRLSRRRAFGRAHRRVRRTGDCAEALLALHRAFEERAGRAVFAHDLDLFIERWPPAEEVRVDLERFFALSENVFYANGGRGAPAECLSWVRDLSGRLAVLERRLGSGREQERRRAWSS